MIFSGLATGAARAGDENSSARPIAPQGASSAHFRLLAKEEAHRAGVPVDLVDAVMNVESGYDPTRVGAVGEIGLMQVRLATAAMLGYRGTPEELANPAINIHYGTTYLGRAWQLAGGDVCRALMKYRAGHGQEQMSQLSATYCSRALAHLASIASPLAAGVVVPTTVGTMMPKRHDGPVTASAGIVVPRHGAAFWRVEEARVKAITARLHAKWRLMAQR